MLLPEEKLLIQDSFREPLLVKIPFPPWALRGAEAIDDVAGSTPTLLSLMIRNRLCDNAVNCVASKLSEATGTFMRILHTADWHLADRLGRIDRTDDLRKAVERVADYCRSEKVDVLARRRRSVQRTGWARRSARIDPPFAGDVRSRSCATAEPS